DKASVLALLQQKVNVNIAEPDGTTALHWAVEREDPDLVDRLIKAGANVNAKNDYGATPMSETALSGNVKIMEKLLDAGADVEAEPRAVYRPAGGLTALHFAAREGCLECTRTLAEAGADLNASDPDNVSPLLTSVLNGHFDLAAYLINQGANPDKWDWWGQSPLYAAVDMNTLPHGGRPDRPSPEETTGLQIIELLLEKGANPNLQLKLLPPYRSVGADRGVDSMLTIGATPLLRAAKAMDAPAIRLLLMHGANPNLPNVRGLTPVMAAAGLGSVDADTRG